MTSTPRSYGGPEDIGRARNSKFLVDDEHMMQYVLSTTKDVPALLRSDCKLSDDDIRNL